MILQPRCARPLFWAHNLSSLCSYISRVPRSSPHLGGRRGLDCGPSPSVCRFPQFSHSSFLVHSWPTASYSFLKSLFPLYLLLNSFYGTYTVQKIFDDNHSQQTSVFAGISTLDSRSDATPILIGCELPTNVIRLPRCHPALKVVTQQM
jgi:hypothetical protein